MTAILFSIQTRVYGKVKKLIEEQNRMFQESIDTQDREKARELTERQHELESEVEEILKKGAELSDILDESEDSYEHAMTSVFESFFRKKYEDYYKIGISPLEPSRVQNNLKIIQSHLANKGKESIFKYADTQISKVSREEMDRMLERWLKVFRHAAENGNWYYHYIGG